MAHRTSARRPNGPAPSLPEPPSLPARRVDLPWPRERYLPGRGPHPLRPGGHGGCGLSADAAPDTALDRGLDLMAAHFVWEAHEAFEVAWRVLPTPEARAIPFGLIKLCAAVLRANAGDDEVAARLLDAGTRALATVPAVRGVATAPILDAVRDFVQACARAEGSPQLGLYRAIVSGPAPARP